MNRAKLFRYIQSIHSSQQVKPTVEALGIDKRQLFRFSSETQKPKSNKYVPQIAAATVGITATYAIYNYYRGTLENCEENGTASQTNEKLKLPSKKNNIPDVDPASYALEITGLSNTSLKIPLNKLKNDFPRHTVTTVLKCSGNCKSDTAKVKENQWSGARLIDVLKAAGYDHGHTGVHNIQFEGLDFAVPDMHYGVIISFEKAMDPKSDVILAYELNGETLTKENGFPLRVLMPGIPGGRQVKWLGRIIISGEEIDYL